MSASKTYVDGVLVTWGDRLFSGDVKGKKGPGTFLKPIASNARKAAKGTGAGQGGSFGATKIRAKLDATLKKHPEVMVKITSSGKSIGQIKSHLDYISRNGEVGLEDQDGNLIEGRESVRDLRDDWRDGLAVIPDEEGKKRETFNVVLSMPPGTDRMGVTNAARDFAKTQFGDRFQYVFATHADDNHPHIHLVVRARGYDGSRLNPRKADLQKWRESFAEKLGDHGIEANATKRKVRGIVRRPTKKTILEAQRRGAALPNAHDPNVNPKNPFTPRKSKEHEKIAGYYAELAKGLEASNLKDDLALAKRLKAFQEQMPANRVYGRPEIAKEKERAPARAGSMKDRDR